MARNQTFRGGELIINWHNGPLAEDSQEMWIIVTFL